MKKKLLFGCIAAILIIVIVAVAVACNRGEPESELPLETPAPTPTTPTPTAPIGGVPDSLAEIIEVTRLRIDMESFVITRGTRFWPDVIIYPEDATDKRFELHSDNEDVLRIQGRYWVAAGVGSATLTATATNGVTSSVQITVELPPATVSFGQDELALNMGDVLTLSFERGGEWAQTDSPATFSSSNTNVATVSQNGVITAVGGGTSTITVTIGEASATLSVTVTVPVRAIGAEVSRIVFSVGERVNFTVRTTPENPTDPSYTVSFSGAEVSDIQGNSFIASSAGEVVITVTAAGGVSGTQTIIVHDLNVFADEVFRLTNVERAAHGLYALERDGTLMQAAVIRAREIVEYFSHTRPDGRHFATSFEEANVPQGRWGENLAAGQRSPAEALEGWMGSQGHREAILDVNYRYIGIGVVMSETGRLYWVQTFRG